MAGRRRRTSPERRLQAAVGRLGWLAGYECPWCGLGAEDGISEWEGDHVVALAGAASPIVPACRKCNRARVGVRASSAQLGRLFRPAVEAGTHSGEDIRRFCGEWAERRYGSRSFIDLAVGDVGPRVMIARRSQTARRVLCPSGQRVADDAYRRVDGMSAGDIEMVRAKARMHRKEATRRGQAARRKRAKIGEMRA